MSNIGRNNPCTCGSTKKYKHCCGAAKIEKRAPAARRVVLPDNIIATVPKAIQLGIEHHRAGRIRKAEASYKAVLAADPQHSDAYHLLGLVAHQRGRYKQAIDLISRAILLNKTAAIFFNNRGEAHRGLGLFDEALADYRMAVSLQPLLAQAWHNQGLAYLTKGEPAPAAACFETELSINPDDAEAHYGFGNALLMLGRQEEAIAEYQKTIAIRPDSAWAYNNIGTALRRLEKYAEAVIYHRKAVELGPAGVELLIHLANALKEAGMDDEAIEVLSRIIELDPKHETAIHLLNALCGIDTDRPSAEYISGVFDAYAANYDHHLTRKLECKAPALLLGVLRRQSGIAALHKLGNVLDLGCGTGLMGIELKPLADRLVGVDLSSRMIEQAAARALYDELIVADLCEFLARSPSETFDLISAADVLNYLGNLSPVFAEAHRVARPGGWVLFSVEHLHESGKDFSLSKSGRYMHAASYIRQLAAGVGFELLSDEKAELRKEKGQPVDGRLFLLRKIPNAAL